jgi:hypothetical protein
MMLAKRLAQGGVALSGGALAAVLSQMVASAGVPTSVVSSTIKAASLFGAGQAVAGGAISVNVAALTEGVLKSMLLNKLKIALAVMLVVAALGSTAGLIYQTRAAEQPQGQGRPSLNETKHDLNEKRADQENLLVPAPRATDKREPAASGRTPPGIKEGVRVVFGSSQMKWDYADERQSPLVVRVRDNWVLLKGVNPQGFSLEGQEGCWVNFNTVDWYAILPK